MGLRVSYIGSTMRKLLVDRDYNTLPASTTPFDPSVPEDYARLPFPLYGYYMDIVGNLGERPVPRLQLELHAALEGRSRRQRRLHAGRTPTATPPTPATARSGRCSSIRTTSRRTAVPIRTSSSTASWRTRPGTFRSAAIASTAPTWRSGRTRCSAAGRSRRSFQARSGQNLTPFFSGFYTTSPWNTGKPLDGLGTFFCCAWRPDQIEDPNSGRHRAKRSSIRPRTRSRPTASWATPRRAA